MGESRFRAFSLDRSPYVWAGAAMLCFIVTFYSRYLGHAPYFFGVAYTLVQIVALIAVVRAYRRVGGIGYLLWLVPIIIELLFWPRLLIQVVFGQTFWYPFWDEKALIHTALFLVGLLLTRRRYASYLQSICQVGHVEGPAKPR